MTYQPNPVKKQYHGFRRTLARLWMDFMHPTQIGITGSQGKTNTTHVISSVLRTLGKTIVTDIKMDSTYNVPITALKVRPWTEYVVWELGIDHPGEMAKHLEIAHPQIGIMTGISPVHTDKEHMGSLETLIAEKQKMLEALPSTGTAIINADNKYVEQMSEHTKATVLRFGSNEKFDIWVDPTAVEITLKGTKGYYHTKTDEFVLETPLIGVHHVYNLMAGYLVLRTVVQNKHVSDAYAKIVSTIKPLKGRMSIDEGPLNTVLLNDSLRANPASTKSGLDTLARIQYPNGRKIAVIGEMGELQFPEEEHRKTGESLASYYFDAVVCIGPLRKFTIQEAIKRGYPEDRIFYASNVREAADILKQILKPGDLWYLKGSLLRNYKRIVQLLNGEKICCDEVMCPYEHCGYGAEG